LFAEYCLQANNEKNVQFIWKPFVSETYKRNKNEVVYALIHGLVSPDERSRIIGIFNSPENIHGDVISLLCLSKASIEGINIKHVRYVHIMEA
jgi:hypothetical protein